MARPPTILSAPEAHAVTPHAKPAYCILAAAIAAAVVAGLVTAMVLSRSPAAAEEHPAALAPAAPVAAPASQGTSVPEASTVFNGKAMPVEEPAPSF